MEKSSSSCWPTMWEIAGHFWHCQSVRLMLNHGMKLHVTVWFFQPSPAGPKGLKGGTSYCAHSNEAQASETSTDDGIWSSTTTRSSTFWMMGALTFEIDGSTFPRKENLSCCAFHRNCNNKKRVVGRSYMFQVINVWHSDVYPFDRRRYNAWICVTGNDRKLWPLSVFAVT